MEKSDEQNHSLSKEIDKFILIVKKDHTKLSDGIEKITVIIWKHFDNTFRISKHVQLPTAAENYFSLGQIVDKLIAMYFKLIQVR